MLNNLVIIFPNFVKDDASKRLLLIKWICVFSMQIKKSQIDV